MNTKYYKNLCVKVITGEANDYEKSLFEEWRSKSLKNREIFSELKNIWDKTDLKTIPSNLGIDEQWKKVEAKIFYGLNKKNDETDKKFPDNLVRLIYTNWKPVVGAALVFIYFIILLYDFGKSKKLFEVELSTKNKKEYFVLPDGSSVHLNKNSSINYYELKNEKEIVLNGKAFFKVKKSNKPFVVKTINACVSVKGTEFEVSVFENKTKVYVKNGVVKLAIRDTYGKQIEILAGQMSSIENKNNPTQPVFSYQPEILKWIYEDLIFDSEPLANVFERLANDYDIDIKIDDKSLSGNKLTGAFNSMDIESAINAICLACDLKYERLTNGYLIKRALKK